MYFVRKVCSLGESQATSEKSQDDCIIQCHQKESCKAIHFDSVNSRCRIVQQGGYTCGSGATTLFVKSAEA